MTSCFRNTTSHDRAPWNQINALCTRHTFPAHQFEQINSLMNTKQLHEENDDLNAFLEPLLPLLGRIERRRWAAFYVQALLVDEGRKTAAGMAERLGGNEQAIQLFINQSSWDWLPIRQALAERLARHTCRRVAWVMDDRPFPKQGNRSVGVLRQTCRRFSRRLNCQVGLSLHCVTPEGGFPIDFQLYLPDKWTEDPVRRQAAGIPGDVTYKLKWELGLEMIDRVRHWDVPSGIMVAGPNYGTTAAFRSALNVRQMQYVVEVYSDVQVRPPLLQRPFGRPPKHPVELPFQSVLDVARTLPVGFWSQISWREGTVRKQSRFSAVRVKTAYRPGIDPDLWLLAEQPVGVEMPTNFWLSNLPEDTPLEELVYWAKTLWWVEHNHQQMQEKVGLDHFEGRSWAGWHHHVTLVMIAFGFLTVERLRSRRDYWVDLPKRLSESSDEPTE